MAPDSQHKQAATVEDLKNLEDRVTDHILHCPVREDAKHLADRIQGLENTLKNGIKDLVTELHRDVREIRANQMRIIFWVLGGVSGITAIAVVINQVI